jgi:CBS domain-containing protein
VVAEANHLPVVENDRLVGIISERDYAERYFEGEILQGNSRQREVEALLANVIGAEQAMLIYRALVEQKRGGICAGRSCPAGTR